MAVAEIVSIGTELLLGQILNTNSHYLAGELALLGIDSIYQVTVGDNVDRIKGVLREALNRSDVVITTGGLGPTADDLTHESIAELFNAELVFDEGTLRKIRALFRMRGLEMPESNRKQAMRPDGSSILVNQRGTAPGIVWAVSEQYLKSAGISEPSRKRHILTFPGVPGEMKTMWQETGKPYLVDQFGPGVIWSVDLKHYGISESLLGENFADLLSGMNPTVAPYAGSGECRLRVSAKAATTDEARRLVEPVANAIRERSAHVCYGENEDTLESVTAKMLLDRNLTVSIAESCTGGLISKRLTDVPGSSSFVGLNVVTYSNDAKMKLLNVSEDVLLRFGAVSSECAEQMCKGVKALAGSDIAIGITGIAGPGGGTEEKPVGLVFIGLSTDRGVHLTKRLYNASLTRAEIRHRSASDAINLLRLYLIDPELLEPSYGSPRQVH